MNDRSGILSPESLPRPGEVALLTAIDAVLEGPRASCRTESRWSDAMSERTGGASRHPPRRVSGDRADARPRQSTPIRQAIKAADRVASAFRPPPACAACGWIAEASLVSGRGRSTRPGEVPPRRWWCCLRGRCGPPCPGPGPVGGRGSRR